jgi:rhodanese-related sulfurtransferase
VTTTVPQLTPAQLAADTTRVVVLDVREPDELASGRIAGSVNIPLGQLRRRVGELDRATRFVTVCRSGRRSQTAAELLTGAGLDVANLDGGMSRWTADGQPVVAP